MAFFQGNDQLDTLVCAGRYNPGETILKSIILPNNSILNLNLADITVIPSNPDITNINQIGVLKIIISWGDGNTETISPYFHIPSSSINVKIPEWTEVSHLYSLHDEQNEISLYIYVYNSLNDCATLIVPITIQFQSLLESGAKFHLVSANITNNNQVSYVFNNSADKSSFVVSSIK